MDFTKEFLDPALLNEGYEVGTLVVLQKELTNARDHLEELSIDPDHYLQIQQILEQLFIVEKNILIIESVIDNKKTLIFCEYMMDEDEDSRLLICFN